MFDLDQEAEEQRELASKQQLEHCSRYRETFSTDSGKYVLEDLKMVFLTPRVAQVGDDLLAIGIRQGQADVANRILKAIEYAETGGNPKQ